MRHLAEIATRKAPAPACGKNKRTVQLGLRIARSVYGFLGAATQNGRARGEKG